VSGHQGKLKHNASWFCVSLSTECVASHMLRLWIDGVLKVQVIRGIRGFSMIAGFISAPIAIFPLTGALEYFERSALRRISSRVEIQQERPSSG
jgi:hypothetical protein